MKKHFALAVSLVMVAVLAAPGCSKLKMKDHPAAVTSARFNPPAVMSGDTITVVVEASDPDEDKLEIEYEWLADGKKLPYTGTAVSSTGYADGAVFTARFRVKELPSGRLGAWQEKSITLGAPAPATIKGVNLEPDPLTTGHAAQAAIDYGEADENDLTFYYRWTINGKVMEGDVYQGAELPGSDVKRGERIFVSICEDEDFKGQVWDSPVMTVIGNPPVFSTEPYIETEGQNVLIKFAAEDPDGDPIKYSLTGAPPGTAQTKDGFRINLATAAPGEYQMTLTADDGTGANATYDLSLTVPEKAQAAPPPPPAQEAPAEEPPAQEPPVQEPPAQEPMSPAPAEGGTS